MANYSIRQVKKTEISETNKEFLDENFLLWYGNLKEAGVENVYLAFLNGEIVGFLTGNIDGLCVAIEVLPDYQGKGIGSALVKKSGCWEPEQNECAEFWGKMNKNTVYSEN